jgi:hypothetical protein
VIFVLYSLFVYFSLEEKTRNLFYCVVFSILDKISFLVHLFLIWSHAVKEWLSVLLPLALDRGVCIITNMGAVDPLGAQEEVLELASNLGLEITVAVAYETSSGTFGFFLC